MVDFRFFDKNEEDHLENSNFEFQSLGTSLLMPHSTLLQHTVTMRYQSSLYVWQDKADSIVR